MYSADVVRLLRYVRLL